MKILTHIGDNLKSFLKLREPILTPPNITDRELLEDAGRKLREAEGLLEEVNDPELIDYAIYQLKAAEKRYDYLYKIIKNKHKL
jgi:hypothetical protein